MHTVLDRAALYCIMPFQYDVLGHGLLQDLRLWGWIMNICIVVIIYLSLSKIPGQCKVPSMVYIRNIWVR